MNTNTTPSEVAQWMLEKLEAEGVLLQPDMVSAIGTIFGERFLRTKANGNTVLGEEVTEAFKLLTEKTVVWERAPSFRWRFRREGDEPGREQRGSSASTSYDLDSGSVHETNDGLDELSAQTDKEVAALLAQQDVQLAEIGIITDGLISEVDPALLDVDPEVNDRPIGYITPHELPPLQ